jgi:hypothetical protein
LTVNLTLSAFDDLADADCAAISANAGDEASASVAIPVVSRKRRRDGSEEAGIELCTATSEGVQAAWDMRYRLRQNLRFVVAIGFELS